MFLFQYLFPDSKTCLNKTKDTDEDSSDNKQLSEIYLNLKKVMLYVCFMNNYNSEQSVLLTK